MSYVVCLVKSLVSIIVSLLFVMHECSNIMDNSSMSVFVRES